MRTTKTGPSPSTFRICLSRPRMRRRGWSQQNGGQPPKGTTNWPQTSPPASWQTFDEQKRTQRRYRTHPKHPSLDPDQRDHCGKTRNLPSGKSDQTIFGTQTVGSHPPSPSSNTSLAQPGLEGVGWHQVLSGGHWVLPGWWGAEVMWDGHRGVLGGCCGDIGSGPEGGGGGLPHRRSKWGGRIGCGRVSDGVALRYCQRSAGRYRTRVGGA